MRLRILLIVALCGFLGAPVFAGEETQPPQHQLPTVPLMDVLEAVSKKTGLVFAVDRSVDDEQWVTMMVKVQNATATQFVPILRPMLPQPAHMIAHPESNMLSIVGRYGNIKRLLELIQTMDYETTQQ